jgi:Uma2 family endonuclease
MNVISRPAAITFEGFCLLVQDGQKADLLDGVIYMASPDNTDANLLNGWLCVLMDLFVDRRDLGRVVLSRVAFRLGPTQGPEPDIAFIRKDRLRRVQPGYVDGPPDLAVEIVSPDSVERDYVQKLGLYRRAGVGEYWIVDPMLQKMTVYRLDTLGRYRVVQPRKGILHSRELPGFWLRPEWLWQDPRPKKTALLAEILVE